MTSEVIYLGDLRTEATHVQSGKKIITDAPKDNHGKGAAFSPTDIAATSIASCMITIMGIAAEARNIDMTGTKAEVIKIMSESPRRINEVQLNISFPKHLLDNDKNVLRKAGEKCPVVLSIHPEIKLIIHCS